MPIKVLIIGSNGLLGQSLVNRLSGKDSYTLFAMASGENRNTTSLNLNYSKIDITNFTTIQQEVSDIAPHFIINALALTNVDSCETEKDLCDFVNVEFVAKLAKLSKEFNVHLIHISTDFIFDGKTGRYAENSNPNPINYYGLSKWKAEQEIDEIGCTYSILRTILVYGKVSNMKRNNIVLWLKQSLEEGKQLSIVNDQFRMPTYVGSIVAACELVMQQKATGTYHISGSEYLSIYEMAIQVADYYKLDQTLLNSVDSNTFTQTAKRPAKTGFVLDKAINELGFQPLSLKEGLTQMDAEWKNTKLS